MKQIASIGIIVAALLIGGSWWSASLEERNSPVVARNGLHWHPRLEMYVRGEKLEIPQNLGLGAVHRPVHTHEDLPLVHLEFEGRVHEEDLMLGEFFESWGRDMREFGENMRMSVDGVPNTDYERYVMRDGDVIELRYD